MFGRSDADLVALGVAPKVSDDVGERAMEREREVEADGRGVEDADARFDADVV